MVSERSKKAAPAVAPEAAAEWVGLEALKPWGKNPRRAPDAAVQRVAASIQRFGFAAPILARRADGEIIAGHTRFAAAQRLGLDRVPVRYLDLDPADAHLLALADNRLTDLGEWDNPQLLELLGDLRQQGQDAAGVAGWTDAEIDALLKQAGDAALGPGGSGTSPEGGSTDPWAEWEGMPEYASGDATAYRSVVVHFQKAEDVAAFERALGLTLTEKAKFTWYPPVPYRDFAAQAYVAAPAEDDDGAA